MQLQKQYTDLKVKEPTRKKIYFKMFKMRFLRFLKMSKNNMKLTSTACWINSKISNRENSTTLMIFLCSHYYWSLLWYNYWRSLILWNSTSWSHLKFTVQIQLAVYPYDLLLIINYNMTGNSVEKHCFMVLNVKLQVKIRFNTFYWVKTII